ncbi:arginase family protein [Muribacter muris]|nr:arginase family protein [Muribacter muris]MBF0784571.1 arginase family protein [Muribacter muris]MBF0826133.1 arginase family protein [Muribacter muris]
MKFIQIRSEIGAGKIGTTAGVDWLWTRYQQEYGETPSHCFSLQTVSDYKFAEAKYIDTLCQFFRRQVVPPLSEIIAQAALPIVISGDHSNTIATLSALCRANPDKRIGVVWIDAHCDLHTPFTTPSGNLHGMSLAAVTRQDNLAAQSRQPSEMVQGLWQQLKKLAPESCGIQLSDLCFLGLRSYEAAEKALLSEHSIPHFSVEEIRQIGLDNVLNMVAQQFEAVDLLYVTFDVDALDAELIPCTGTPEPNGFREQEVAQILQAVLGSPKLAMFEITELNPALSVNSQDYERVYRLFKFAVQCCKRSVGQ